MSTTLYFMRHGESEANERDAFLGHHDLHLTEVGRKQAAVTAEYLKDLHPDVIYASDLARAYETAQATAERLNMPIIKDKNLREIDAGLWDNVTFSELIKKFPESYGMWINNVGLARCDGGESVVELQKRVVDAVTAIAQKHENSVVYIFTHATPIRVFAAHCLNKSPEDIKTIPWASNASVTEVVYDKDGFHLVEYSRDGFMGSLVTKLPEST